MGKYNIGGTTYIGVSTWTGMQQSIQVLDHHKIVHINVNLRRSYMIAGSDAQTNFIYSF